MRRGLNGYCFRAHWLLDRARKTKTPAGARVSVLEQWQKDAGGKRRHLSL